MSYLDTIGAQDITPKEPGYLATIGATEGVSEVAPSQYIDSVEECGCHVEEPVREQGYLGWFANLEECLEAHPQPRLGMSFKNVTTRSVWLYDGVRWVNTTLGNPFTMINDEENAGWVRRGIAQSFYYLPKEEGEKQFAFEIEGGGSATINVPITSISEVVFIEWTGETLGYAIHQLDPDVVKNEGGVLKTLSGDVVIDINELLENIVILDQYTDDIDKRLHAEADRAKAAEQTLRDEIIAVGDVAVKHEAQTLSTEQKRTARNNIGAVGVSSVTEHGALLEENGSAIYPTTQAKHVQLSNGVDSETMLYATHAKAKSVEDKLNAFFANAEVSGNAVDTLKELQEYITSDAEAAAEMLQRVSENAKAIATLSDDSVHYSAQSKSSSEQTQARRNIGAVGVAPVSGMTLLEHNGQSIYPTTNSSEVRMVDETGTYTGTLDEKIKWLEENNCDVGLEDVGAEIEGVEGITSNLLNLIVTVGGEYYYNYEEETEKCINKGLRIWVSGRASGQLCLRLMRNVKRNGSNERSGWRPIDANSRNGELPTNIDGWYKPLDYVLLPFPTNAQNEYIYNNGLLKDGDGVMIGPHNLVEQLFTVANDCATIRTGHSTGSRKKVKSGQVQERVDVRNLGLAIYRYDSNGRPSERLSNVAPIGVVMLDVTYESGVLNAEYKWGMNNQSVVNPVGIVRN